MDSLCSYLYIALSSFSVYAFMIIGLRLFGKKELAQLSVPDLVFVLLISNAVQNAMVGSDTSLQGGLVAATTLFLSNYVFKWFLYRYSSVQKVIQGNPILLVYQGQVHDENLHKARITMNELTETIREHGTSDLREVNLAMLEIDGNISVLTNDFKTQSVQSGLRKRKRVRNDSAECSVQRAESLPVDR